MSRGGELAFCAMGTGIGVGLIINGAPTRGMTDEANHAGTYKHPLYPNAFPRIQIITIDDLLAGGKPSMPPTQMPYIQAKRTVDPTEALF